MAGEEEVIYHDVSPRASDQPSPPPATIPSGSAEDDYDEIPPKKGLCTFTNKIIAMCVVVMVIILSVTMTRPGALTIFGKAPPENAATTSDVSFTYWPTYAPTFMPTYLPTMMPTSLLANTSVTVPTYLPTMMPTTANMSVNVEETSNATDATTTSTVAAIEEVTTTETPHPVCGNATSSRVFKVNITPTTNSSTYTLSSKDDGTVYSTKVAGELPMGVMTEEKICIEAGEYTFEMNGGACVSGFFRGILILYSCNAATLDVEVD